MKLLNLIFIAIFCSINVQAQVKTKYALIIAISNYDYPATGWAKLSSHNDIELIETALKKQEFKTENIDIVEDVNAAGIISAFEKLKDIKKKSKNNDVVITENIIQDNNNLEDKLFDELYSDILKNKTSLNKEKYLILQFVIKLLGEYKEYYFHEFDEAIFITESCA